MGVRQLVFQQDLVSIQIVKERLFDFLVERLNFPLQFYLGLVLANVSGTLAGQILRTVHHQLVACNFQLLRNW